MAWSTPKTNWTPADGVSDVDMIRIEENARVLESNLNSLPTTSGTAPNYAVTVPDFIGLTAGRKITVNFHAANSSAATTLNVNTTGAKSITKPGGGNPSIKIGAYSLVYTGTNFQLLGEGGEYGNAQASDVLEKKTIGTDSGLVTGTMTDYSGITTPSSGTDNIISVSDFSSNANGHYGVVRHIVPVSGRITPTTTVPQTVYGLNPAVIKAGQVVGKVGSGVTGTFTSDANAAAPDIAAGKTAYVNGVKITGTNTYSRDSIVPLNTSVHIEFPIKVPNINNQTTPSIYGNVALLDSEIYNISDITKPTKVAGTNTFMGNKQYINSDTVFLKDPSNNITMYTYTASQKAKLTVSSSYECIDSDSIYLIEKPSNYCLSRYLSNGTLKWKYDFQTSTWGFTPPYTHNMCDSVYTIQNGNKLYKINKTTGLGTSITLTGISSANNPQVAFVDPATSEVYIITYNNGIATHGIKVNSSLTAVVWDTTCGNPLGSSYYTFTGKYLILVTSDIFACKKFYYSINTSTGAYTVSSEISGSSISGSSNFQIDPTNPYRAVARINIDKDYQKHSNVIMDGSLKL